MLYMLVNVLYALVWIVITIIGGVVGLWWPIIGVGDPGPGDGMGMMLYGGFGLLIGTVLGGFIVAWLSTKFTK